MRFVSLGATDDIGASCHLLEIAETGIMLDAGTDPEEDGPNSLPAFGFVKDRPEWFVDHAVISHAHQDHIGALPILIREFPHAQVHMSRATRDLAEFVLPASARLQRRRRREGSSSHEPLFGEEELEVQSFVYRTHGLEQPFDVEGVRTGRKVSVSLYHAGHILGAVGVQLSYVDGRSRRTIFYTGDTNLRSQTIIPGGSYPREPVDVLILESTLGSDPEAEETTRRGEEDCFAKALRTVWDRGGTSLVPVFAVGRAQEVLALIDRYKKRGLLPETVPVYTAGAMRAVAELYDKTRFTTPRLNTDFMIESVEQARIPRSASAKERILEDPGIHVVSSGMMFPGTLSNRLAQRLVGNPKNAVMLVGFAQADSPAGRLMAAAQVSSPEETTEVTLDDRRGPQPLLCEIHRFRLSGHSHRRDLMKLVSRLSPGKVILVHGEARAREWLADNIDFFHPEIDVMLPSRQIEIEV